MDPGLELVFLDRTMMIMRLAMLEGLSLFALVILMISVLNGPIYTYGNFWFLVLPWVIQTIYILINYLSPEKYTERIMNNFVNHNN